jgi:hypothetical protein
LPYASKTWSVDAAGAAAGWSITSGNGTDTIHYHAGATATATFTLTVIDANGCQTTCSVTVGCTPPQDESCGLTQGFYGNQGGKFGCDPALSGCVGMTAERIMTLLLTTYGDLIVGDPSSVPARSFKLRQANAAADAACIVKKLPANSTPTFLNPAGNGFFTNGGCNTSTNIPTGAGNKWLNVLLGQTITLSFNIRYDTFLHPGHGLGELELCASMVTQATLPGPDGKPGTGDEVIDPGPDHILGTGDDPKMTVTIPNNVLCYISGLPGGATVNNLLKLANLALSNQLPAGITAADVNVAVSAINNGFDRCRFLISCTGGCIGQQADSTKALADPLALPGLDPVLPSITAGTTTTTTQDSRGTTLFGNGIYSIGSPISVVRKEAEAPPPSVVRLNAENNNWVRRIYRTAYGNSAAAAEVLSDTHDIGNGVMPNRDGEYMLDSNKDTFVGQFVQRERFASQYPMSLTPAEFVSRLFKNAGIAASARERAVVIAEFGKASDTRDVGARARALRRVAENATDE